MEPKGFGNGYGVGMPKEIKRKIGRCRRMKFGKGKWYRDLFDLERMLFLSFSLSPFLKILGKSIFWKVKEGEIGVCCRK